MCGILLELCLTGKNQIQEGNTLLKCLCNRGPDGFRNVTVNVNDLNINFWGTVLWMQGPKITVQPIENEIGVLLHNGDIFDDTWDESLGDTLIIFEKFQKIQQSTKHIIEVIRSLKGPFSIIYYEKTTHKLYFTRDRIGRNSLLFYKNDTSVIISSVLGRNYKSCIEIPATHIVELNLLTNNLKLHAWLTDEIIEQHLEIWWKNIISIQSMPDEHYSVEVEIEFNTKDPIIEEVLSHETTDKTKLMHILLENETLIITVEKLIHLLNKSVEIRLKTQPNKCKDCLLNKIEKCHHCTVGILFSGGLDCTVLAVLADKYIDYEQSIDLMNVAFEKDGCNDYNVPDRVTGRQSYEELKSLCPNRKWNFIEINVTRRELETMQRTCISDLVYPRQTILDESLGSALWFASRGNESSCRLLLLGSGADELFGGYSRHRNAFKYHGWGGLHKELMLDWNRISFRNLARDNRVICDHGRQPRLPYLDEEFSMFILGLPPWLKCFPCDAWGNGFGDKYILRLAAFKLGLRQACIFPKRALQFGSRIANKKEKGSDISKNMQNYDLNKD